MGTGGSERSNHSCCHGPVRPHFNYQQLGTKCGHLRSRNQHLLHCHTHGKHTTTMVEPFEVENFRHPHSSSTRGRSCGTDSGKEPKSRCDKRINWLLRAELYQWKFAWFPK